MKYIRTKDGIYNNRFMNGVIPELLSPETIGFHIEKQADTIEELCDYLIVFDNDNKIKDIVKISDRPKDLIENKLFVEHLFGSNYTLAIETEKGLIYVAKMNDKGELELL